MNIEVLDINTNVLYLGRELSLTSPHDAELRHRVRKAWAKFNVYRSELTDKGVPLPLRLKLYPYAYNPVWKRILGYDRCTR